LGITPQAVFNLRKCGLNRLKNQLERMYISEANKMEEEKYEP
jgi:hypothetical protein